MPEMFYDPSADVLTFDGRKYTGEFLRALSFQRGVKAGILFEIRLNKEGCVEIGRFQLNGLLRWIVTHWWKV